MDLPESTAAAAGSKGRYDEAVFEAQIDHLYQQLPRLLAYTMLVSILLAVMLLNAVPTSHTVGWIAGIFATVAIRFLLHRWYMAKKATRPVSHWARMYVGCSGIAGLVWGLAGVLLFAPDRLELQSLILLVLAGMGAGSASVLPVYLPAFYAFLPTMMAPAGVMMLIHGGQFHYFMAVFDFVFLFGVLAFGRAIGKAFRSSLELRFENIDLVERLEQQKDELVRANLAKSRFLAAASHDLRQPMHALALFSEILQQEAADSRTRAIAESIRGSVSVLERLFSALLDISRIDAGVLKPDTEIFRIGDVIERVYTDCLPMANEKQLALSAEAADVWTVSDPTLLERILRNLVVNAIRYTSSGTVSIECMESGNTAHLIVDDTGVGIPKQSQEEIFEEFTQLENPERDRSKGLGLGLSIVRRLAILLDHPLALDSAPEKGTRFTVNLPVVERPPRASLPEPEIDALADRKLGLRVLVIDDDEDILVATRQLLESWGCEVSTALTAAAAVAVARSGPAFDALMSDFRLPEHASGTEVVGQVREIQGRDVPALLITGDTEPARLREAEAACLELLHKPVHPARLRAWLQRIALARA
jgi:signal transduction histidine kinase